MDETAAELDWLQDLLDRSYAAGGTHLRSIHTARARLDAEALVERLQNMSVLVVATVTADGRPLTGPVDSFLFRGRFHFGTSRDAVRTRHLQRRPQVSATHVRGEELVVTVHGRARALDLHGGDAAFAQVTREHYGQGWDEWGHNPPAAWAVEPERMYAADMSVHRDGG
jgi:nitroimidazol reductase NimA-like FMN-containing flavoprotein (pyridoxamine 5'-phosphate oxidase superfamily)